MTNKYNVDGPRVIEWSELTHDFDGDNIASLKERVIESGGPLKFIEGYIDEMDYDEVQEMMYLKNVLRYFSIDVSHHAYEYWFKKYEKYNYYKKVRK